MMKAFVLINTELGKEASVVEALSQVAGIREVFSLYGIYDVIAEVEAESMEKVKEIVFNSIRRLETVKTTITLITYGEPLQREE
jgi:DNA-binding Lrp family transcriptional regulator